MFRTSNFEINYPVHQDPLYDPTCLVGVVNFFGLHKRALVPLIVKLS